MYGRLNKRIVISLLLLLFIFQFFSLISGENIPEPSNEYYVYDKHNILSQQTKDYIIDTNIELKEKTGSQVVVAIPSNIEGDIDLYSVNLFEKWKIGSKDLDNGILILLDYENREVRIEVGYGLEGALPDIKAKEIIEEVMIPYFKVNDYDRGLLLGFNNILKEIEREYDIKLNNNIDIIADNYGESDLDPKLILLIIVVIIILIFIDFKFFNGAINRNINRNYRRFYSGGYYGRNMHRNKNIGGGGRSGGGGAKGKW